MPIKKTNKTSSPALFAQAQKVLVGGVNSPVRAFRAVGGEPRFIARAQGPYLYDVEGKKYVDFVLSWGPMILGHAHKNVVAKVTAAAKNGFSFGAPSEAETLLAQEICAVMPSIEKVRLVSSGTEATMTALRLARGFTHRSKIIKFAGCYHGHSDGLLVAAGSGATTLGVPDSLGVPKAFAQETWVFPFNDSEAIERAFAEYGHEIAGVIVEPVVGNMGVVAPKPGFLQGLRELCSQYGAILIFDEVMTGFRVALGGAQELYGVVADLTCLGKIVGGGFPVGAVGGKAEIMDRLAPLGKIYQAGTLSGNPVAMAAGLETLRTLRKLKPHAQLSQRAETWLKKVSAILAEKKIPVHVTQVGAMFTIFFNARPVTDYTTALTSNRERYAAFFHGLLAQGVYFPPSQFEAAFLSIAHSSKILDFVLQKIERLKIP